MIAKARERGGYDALLVDDALAMLGREPPGSFDLIVAADALVYVGDLAPLFVAVRGCADRGRPLRLLGRNLRGRRI